MAHRKFDAEDLRQLESLGPVCFCGLPSGVSLDALEQRGEALRQSDIELAQRLAELQKLNVQLSRANAHLVCLLCKS